MTGYEQYKNWAITPACKGNTFVLFGYPVCSEYHFHADHSFNVENGWNIPQSMNMEGCASVIQKRG